MNLYDLIFGTQGQRKDNNMIDTDFLEVRGNLLRCNKTFIQLSNISMMATTDYAKTPFPTLIFILGLIGICIIKFQVTIGAVLIGVAIIGIVDWKTTEDKRKRTKKLNIILNGGITYSIKFNDMDFLARVMKVFAKILSDSSNHPNVLIDIKNNNINNIRDNTFYDSSSAVSNHSEEV